MFQLKLAIVGGDAKRADVEIKKLPATIGRAREATITLPHTLVSRKHCEIFMQENQLFVKDLKSLNGTYVNNEKISKPTAIPSGQLLTLGNVTFRALYGESSDTDLNPQQEIVERPTNERKDDETLDTHSLGLHPSQKCQKHQKLEREASGCQ